MRLDDEPTTEVLGTASYVSSVVFHVIFITLVLTFGSCKSNDEVVIPIDLSVVVNENLDGVENEPPPLNDPKQEPTPPTPTPPTPTPPTPPPTPQSEPTPVPDAVVQVPDKPKHSDIKDRIKRPDKKQKETKSEQKKTNRFQDRIRPTDKQVNINVDNRPSGNGRTDKKTLSDDEIRRRLQQGIPPGTTTQLTESEDQLGVSLIKQALYAQWNPRPAWTPSLRTMCLKITLGLGGRIVGYKLIDKSGDAAADQTVLRAASRVGQVNGLSVAFVRRHRDDIVIRFTVTPE